MANDIRYVRKRSNGIYYYERRIPRGIDPHEAITRFGTTNLYRRSLNTKRQTEALRNTPRVEEWFEQQVKAAGPHLLSDDQSGDQTRQVTPEVLRKITLDAKARTIRPWARQVTLAELGGAPAEILEQMIHDRELNGSELKSVLFDREKSQSVRIPNVPDLAEAIITAERLNAPADSDARALVARAVRDGLIAGEMEVDAILGGERSAIPTSPPRNKLKSPTLSMVVADYIAQQHASRTIREVQGALKAFVAAVGDLPLDELTRADFLRFCELEGSRVVGGKTRESVVRPISPETLKKKITLLSAAISRTISLGKFDGPNPAAKIDVRQFAKPVSKQLMPDKRPFDTHELNLILRHPWFTGSTSASKPHNPGE